MEIDEISEEWSADDWVVVNYDFEKQNEWDWGWSWGNWVMNAGKKVLMAGIVITSAPVLLPPILLLSAIGAAVSVPSGVVLASYACTHKLMTKLLPPPPLPLKYYDEEEEEDDDDEVKMSEDVKNEVEMRIELVEDDEKYNQVGREMSSSSSSSSSEGEDSAHVEEIQVKKELVLRDVDDGKQGNNHGVVDVKVNVNVKQDEPKKVLKEEKDEPKKGLREEKDEPKKVLKELKDEPKKVLKEEKDEPKPKKVLKEEKDEPKKVLKEEKDEPKKVLKEEKDTHGGVNGGFHSHEEPIGEEKIWEKIDAIRVIVGFKAPKRSSYVEEVKALYRFTGIQPPTPTEDQSHLSHLNFLMSVIGLK